MKLAVFVHATLVQTLVEIVFKHSHRLSFVLIFENVIIILVKGMVLLFNLLLLRTNLLVFLHFFFDGLLDVFAAV